ncbi:L,D-transpeptidase [Primorskyibacter sp. S187A]|uniref:L,D-transpeptidase n=1 Tax=Primorskyibacter sp. S187A TaxID=3415130 RepID=UPI003C7D0370
MGFAASVIARVDVSTQTMTVYHHGEAIHTWPVSTARPGKWTPRGSYSAKWLSKHHKSSLYNNAPMPYSIFFRGNFAVHGTNQVDRLGSPASAGCIRLHTDNAAKLFRMAQEAGLKNTKIVIEN